MTTAEDLDTAFKQLGYPARIGTAAEHHSCETTINGIATTVYFSRDSQHRSIRWQGNDGWKTIADRDTIMASDLAARVVDSLINPA
jgi:hypothetical protein